MAHVAEHRGLPPSETQQGVSGQAHEELQQLPLETQQGVSGQAHEELRQLMGRFSTFVFASGLGRVAIANCSSASKGATWFGAAVRGSSASVFWGSTSAGASGGGTRAPASSAGANRCRGTRTLADSIGAGGDRGQGEMGSLEIVGPELLQAPELLQPVGDAECGINLEFGTSGCLLGSSPYRNPVSSTCGPDV